MASVINNDFTTTTTTDIPLTETSNPTNAECLVFCDMGAPDFQIKPCGHWIHHHCLETWHSFCTDEQINQCPLCRSVMDNYFIESSTLPIDSHEPLESQESFEPQTILDAIRPCSSPVDLMTWLHVIQIICILYIFMIIICSTVVTHRNADVSDIESSHLSARIRELSERIEHHKQQTHFLHCQLGQASLIEFEQNHSFIFNGVRLFAQTVFVISSFIGYFCFGCILFRQCYPLWYRSLRCYFFNAVGLSVILCYISYSCFLIFDNYSMVGCGS